MIGLLIVIVRLLFVIVAVESPSLASSIMISLTFLILSFPGEDSTTTLIGLTI